MLNVTARAQMRLLETLRETGSVVMVKPGVLIQAFAAQTFAGEGNVIDEILGSCYAGIWMSSQNGR